ncbi:hypothetical protein JCM7686_2003 [Paracoccus aminophilus JCM 7686]|uniref:Gene transfer agent family protein n=2 Tax=Paracoccus aminophilus TaxID=34003 RepID=S5YGH1_PARAH|nr:hypothetical protein JCM7686_2003 [Paracoccus aminophilus JCM 7686]
MMEALVLIWPGGEHAFRLPLAQLELLQQKTEAGPEFLLNRINLGQWAATDLFETVRAGLIGGGLSAVEAQARVVAAFERHPLIEFKVPAQAILGHALYGPPDDPVGEPGPVTPTPENSEKTDSGSSAPSTASQPPLA